jgi:hypothetical protein
VTKMDVPMAADPLRLALKDLVYVEAAVRAEDAGLVGWLRENVDRPVVSPLHAGFDAAQARAAAPGAPSSPNQDSVARVVAAVDAMAPMGASVNAAFGAQPSEPECGGTCAVIA